MMMEKVMQSWDMVVGLIQLVADAKYQNRQHQYL